MSIHELSIEGYRSFRSEVWRPGALNVLIGPNASGKSNLLKALELLAAAAAGGLAKHIQREGGMEAVVWDGRAGEIRVVLKTVRSPDQRSSLEYELRLGRIGNGSAYRIDRETLGAANKEGQGVAGQGGGAVGRILLDRNGDAAKVQLGGPEPPVRLATYVNLESLLDVFRSPVVATVEGADFQRALSEWKLYQGFQTHRDADVRRAQVTRLETQVDPDGQNLIPVLHTLYTTHRDFKDELNIAMRAAFGDDFDELVFPPAADQRIQMRIRWKSLRREQSTADLSDGTLRFLLLIAILANPSPPPLVAIDEPETGLHPSMLRIVAEYAREAARRTQVVFTTHSPEFLDAFGDEPPTTTIVERVDGATTLRNVDPGELARWMHEYSLGELFRSRNLETLP